MRIVDQGFLSSHRGSRFSFFSNHGFGYNKIVSALQSALETMVESKNKKRDRNIAGTSNYDVTKRPDLKDLQSASLQSFKSRANERTIDGARNGEQAFSDGKTESNDGANSQDGRSSGKAFSTSTDLLSSWACREIRED
jgi:hypothetical protein